MDKKKAFDIYTKLHNNISSVIKGKDEVITKLLCAFFSGGHVLLEDVPGTGKTTLAKTLAKSIDCDFKRIQFTPDLLPSDIIGVSIFNQKSNEFKFNKGPLFTNILLADEINRASPRTQSALLESMAENQVSTEGVRFELEKLFFVIATQNPVESHGTYPLPEAQMDRFMIKLSLGYADINEEVEILFNQKEKHPLENINPVVTKEEIIELRNYIQSIRISEELAYYIINIVSSTREAEHILLGASPRASISLMKLSQAYAMINNNDFVIPEYIQTLAEETISHRLIIDPQLKFSGKTPESIVKKIIENIKVPI